MRILSFFLCFCFFWVSSVVVASKSIEQDGSAVDKNSQSKAYYNDRERGWYWYEDPSDVEEEEPEKVAPDAIVVQPVPVLSPREILKKQGEQWEDALATAILNPTKENYLTYLAMTSKIQQQSQDFSTGFKQAIWVSPEYDYTLTKPRNTQAIIAQNEQESKLDENELYRLSQQNGLIFFFRSDCPFCHRFAPILKKFSERYGFSIIPVSLDGKGLPEYPYPKPNYEMGRKLNVSVVPALFMVNPDTNAVSAVGYGYADWSQLTTKVLFAAQQLEGSAMLKVGDVR